MIEKVRRGPLERFLQGLDEWTVWMAHKYASGELRWRQSLLPTLKVKQEDGTLEWLP